VSQATPARIMQLSTGFWASGILCAAVSHRVFDHLQDGAGTAELAENASISQRGAQALLDGLLGLELIKLDSGRYTNTDEASTFLVSNAPGYIGGFAEMFQTDIARWAHLTEAVKTGKPPYHIYEDNDEMEWDQLVLNIASLAYPPANASAEHLGISSCGPFRMLDIGGGAGVYSVVWLSKNESGTATQIDRGKTNSVAKKYVQRFGVADRFSAIDGNLLEMEFGKNDYDFIIYAHMAHGFGAEQNVDIMRKLRRTLKPGGTLAITEFVLDDQRRGSVMALLFSANMLHATEEGQAWCESDYRNWAAATGFKEIEFQSLAPNPTTLIYLK